MKIDLENMDKEIDEKKLVRAFVAFATIVFLGISAWCVYLGDDWMVLYNVVFIAFTFIIFRREL